MTMRNPIIITDTAIINTIAHGGVPSSVELTGGSIGAVKYTETIDNH